MENFEFYAPTRIIFGDGTISKLNKYMPPDVSVLLCYGGGSIKRNGVYDQVLDALSDWKVYEFGGIEPNPDYDTLTEAIDLGREKNVGMILAVGGGSVIDGAKLVAAGIPYQGGEPWDIVKEKVKVKMGEPLPLATVLTLPATGSEMNGTSVISRRATQEKFAWRSEAMFPVFSILDPTATYSLPESQVRNGIVDAYVHVMEQYATYPVGARLQDRQAEGILLTLQEIGRASLDTQPNYKARANLMWSATNALNSLIGKGVPSDWATHMIGHELTALYGLAHAESLAVVLPHLLKYQQAGKADKLEQYARRVWGLSGEGENLILAGLDNMCEFFHQNDMPTRLVDYDIDPDDAAEKIEARFTERDASFGEHNDIGPVQAAEILRMSR